MWNLKPYQWIFCIVTLKFIDLFIFWMIVLPMNDFCCMLSFGNYWFAEVCRSSRCCHISLCNILKVMSSFFVCLFVFNHSSHQESVPIGKLSSWRWQIQVFQNSNSHWKLGFYHWQWLLPVVFLEVAVFIHFWDNHLSIIVCLIVILSSKNVFHEKSG